MSQEIKRKLHTIELRLREVAIVLSVMGVLIERRDASRDVFRQYHGYWDAVNLSFQTTFFTGIYSLVDDSKNAVSLHQIIGSLKKTKNAVPKSLADNVATIRNRYKPYRDKVFSHTDISRHTALRLDFEKEKFTREIFVNDMSQLEYVHKVLGHVSRGEPIPECSDFTLLICPHTLTAIEGADHTSKMLEALATALRTSEGAW